MAMKCDVMDLGSIKSIVEFVTKEYGRLDILVNNAGMGNIPKPIEQISTEEWDFSVALNLKPVFFFTRAVSALMKAQRYGRIINVSSIGG
jgi:NAD(P)-dependent dehydrogenase (short-subunit alcohol dehydrogenase family)